MRRQAIVQETMKSHQKQVMPFVPGTNALVVDVDDADVGQM
jgi:hypothetical protein